MPAAPHRYLIVAARRLPAAVVCHRHLYFVSLFEGIQQRQINYLLQLFHIYWQYFEKSVDYCRIISPKKERHLKWSNDKWFMFYEYYRILTLGARPLGHRWRWGHTYRHQTNGLSALFKSTRQKFFREWDLHLPNICFQSSIWPQWTPRITQKKTICKMDS